ncbi:MAG: IclR family transcriptional regulator [Thiothrix sp.]|nr:MAG: IclR family transcriptional regulator [Thiothrix sp.]
MNLDKAESQTGTLGKALAVLDVIATSYEPLRFTDLLNRLGQPRGSLHRQISHLLEEGLITLNADTGTYELGVRLLNWASLAWSQNSLRQVAAPFLAALHERTNETVHLAVLRDDRVVYLDKVESCQAVRMHSQIGNTSPVYCTGVGKAMLSVLDQASVAELAQRLDFQVFTKHTLTSPAALLAEVEQIRAQHYAEDREEHEVGIRCVAAPLVSAQGELRGGISVTTPVYRLQAQQLEQWRVWVVETAQAINNSLKVKLGPHA